VTEAVGELFHHMRCEMRVLLNEKMEPPFIDCRQPARRLRHSVRSTWTVIDQRHLADQCAWHRGLDHIITKPNVHFPFQQHVHHVTLIAFLEKEIAGCKLHGITIFTEKVRRIHEGRDYKG
jgi:hypothetical protein